MLIQTHSAKFLIELNKENSECLTVRCDSELELSRLFGSLRVQDSNDFEYPFFVKTCKQEYSDALILLVKEIDYSEFSMLSF